MISGSAPQEDSESGKLEEEDMPVGSEGDLA